MKHILPGIALIGCVMAAPLTAQQPTDFPTGRFTMIMRDTTNQLHRATLEFTKDSHYIITHQGHVMFMGTYQIDGDRITLLGRNDTPCLDASGEPVPGLYTWYVRDGYLVFTQLNDACNTRRDQAMIALFYPVGTEP